MMINSIPKINFASMNYAMIETDFEYYFDFHCYEFKDKMKLLPIY